MRKSCLSSRVVASVAAVAAVLLTALTLSAASDSPLVSAIRKRDAGAVQALLRQRANPNAPQADLSTPLHWAAHVDDLAIADLLIKAGARTDVSNDTGFAPLHLACTNRSTPMVERLLAAGANPNAA